MSLDGVQTLILAGQRQGVIDPLCAEFDVDFKVEAPIAGQKMFQWVTDALDKSGLSRPFLVSGYPNVGNGFIDGGSGAGPADSALIALATAEMPCLMTTGDHPLLTADMIIDFVAKAKASSADFCVGLATADTIQADYPETKRTYLKFSDVSVSGCNLFYIANSKGLAALEFWKEAQHLRKQPLKLARKIGIGLGGRYAAGKLSLDGAFEEAGRKMGIAAKPILVPFAEAAIDVDKVSDHALVQKILQSRFKTSAT